MLAVPRQGVAAQPSPSVILIIGDGMGGTAQQLLRLLDGPLAIDRMDDSAVVLTTSESDVVTDSAAGATAMATGVKTRNGAVGVDAAGKKVVNIAELAKKAGKRIGILTTSYLWDATPAAFYAHEENRKNFAMITRQALEAKPDLLMGGGEAQLLPEKAKGRFGKGEREDGENLVTAFQRAGYTVGYDASIAKLPHLGLLAREALYEGRPPKYAPEVTLPAMVKGALAALEDSPRGFLLVVEEEGIDEMAHANAVEPLVEALRAWNQAVALALEYRRRHPNTIVLVTADHETGNMDIVATKECRGKPMWSRAEKAFCLGFSTRGHGGMPVTLYSAGVDVEDAVLENTAVFQILKKALALDEPAR
jgi:alkaline phosphatase